MHHRPTYCVVTVDCQSTVNYPGSASLEFVWYHAVIGYYIGDNEIQRAIFYSVK